MVNLAPGGFGAGYQSFLTTGLPNNAGQIYTYQAGTSTPAATYTSYLGTVANANPIVLAADGRAAEIWLTTGQSYKFVVQDSLGNTLGTYDNLTGINDSNAQYWAIAGGTANAITASYTPPNASLFDGMLLYFRATAANTSTTPTFAPDGLTPHTITCEGGAAMANGYIPGNLAECIVRYNLANLRWELLNPAFGAVVNNATQPVIGTVRNLSFSIATAGVSGTVTFDEAIVETALGSTSYKDYSGSLGINLSTTGAGGMDTGSAPVSGYVSIYLAYNPTTSTWCVFACNVTTSTSSVYAGTNLPSGYTATALISIWATNSSSQFVVGYQIDRDIYIALTVVLSDGTATSLTSTSLSAAVPPGARSWTGIVLNGGGGANTFAVGGSASAIGLMQIYLAVNSATGPIMKIPIITSQTTFYSVSSPTSASINVTGYSI